jgi:hypothetical protein
VFLSISLHCGPRKTHRTVECGASTVAICWRTKCWPCCLGTVFDTIAFYLELQLLTVAAVNSGCLARYGSVSNVSTMVSPGLLPPDIG